MDKLCLLTPSLFVAEVAGVVLVENPYTLSSTLSNLLFAELKGSSFWGLCTFLKIADFVLLNKQRKFLWAPQQNPVGGPWVMWLD